MGKRSDFERHERDYYRTPPSAVAPLLAHLPIMTHFIEPCAGDGALIDALEAVGHKCVYAADIEPQANSIRQSCYSKTPYMPSVTIITNPPWTRDIFHRIIVELTRRAPQVWLLADADWAHTKQASPYLQMCSKIVAVGRVKWFGNTAGKDNAAWYCFERTNDGVTKFYGR